MEPSSYELLKLRQRLLSWKRTFYPLWWFRLTVNKHAQDEKLRYDKLEKMSFCCLRLLEIYREYTKKLKNKE